MPPPSTSLGSFHPLGLLAITLALLPPTSGCTSDGGQVPADCIPGSVNCDCAPMDHCAPGLVCKTIYESHRECRSDSPTTPGSDGPSATGDAPVPADSGVQNPSATTPFSGLYSAPSYDYRYQSYFLFGSNNSVFLGKPSLTNGLPDFASASRSAPQKLGTYRIQDDTLTITNQGKDVSYAIETWRGAVVFSRNERRSEPYRPCTRSFSGLYRWRTHFTTIDADFFPVHILVSYTGIFFHPDGTFEYSSTGNGPTVAAPTASTPDDDGLNVEGRGTYAIRGLEMTLTFANGHRMTDLFQCWQNEDLFSWGSRVFAPPL